MGTTYLRSDVDELVFALVSVHVAEITLDGVTVQVVVSGDYLVTDSAYPR